MLKRIVLSMLFVIPLALVVAPGESRAQILSAERCQNAYNGGAVASLLADEAGWINGQRIECRGQQL